MMTRQRRLYLSNGSKYRLRLHDGRETKGIWSTDKFCWLIDLGRKRVTIEEVKRVAVVDSNIKSTSATYGWFPTDDLYLDKWQPLHRDVWVHPYAKTRHAIPLRVPAHD